MADGDAIESLNKNKLSGQEEKNENVKGSETPGVSESSATTKNEDSISAGDADVDDDGDNRGTGADSMSRKKSKPKKLIQTKEAARSVGESDNQMSPADYGKTELSDQNKSKAELNSTEHKAANTVKLIGAESGFAAPNKHEEKSQQIQKMKELMILGADQTAPRKMEDAKRRQYQFWNTQLVPGLDEEVVTNELIEEEKKLIEELRHEPYSIPDGFIWDSLVIDDPVVLKEIYTLLKENYVEDDGSMLRFDYSPDFLQWALKPPGWLRDWHLGVRVAKSGKLVGFISGIPIHIRVYDITKKMIEINFLCVHKKLRSKKVAPVLITESARRAKCHETFQAVYTAAIVLPKPVSICRYWHRSLNPRKLIEAKFLYLDRNMTMQRAIKLYKLPDATKTAGFRPMENKDIDQCYSLVTKYLKKFDLAPVFTRDEFCHLFIPRPEIVNSYVVEVDNHVTDFVCFYTVSLTVINNPVHKSLKAAYSFYNVSTKTPWADLMQDALIVAKQLGYDLFNALDLMDNKEFLEKLKFCADDNNLQYYLYNWKCPTMSPEKMVLCFSD